ncbi:MAG: hypothetical protein RMJ07_04515 [Nitrososphaerota archaeon]|nr:hypothetical protein [Candidatus Bathyarchaeota archaeon]MDW8048927.1 hypothetical protein [Nitrososphaerota archaeon]
MSTEDLTLQDIVVMYDRDLGPFIFKDFRSYNSLLDDAEWLLERSHQRSRGFIIRPVRQGSRDGLWIGEYDHGASRISRQELIFDEGASELSRIMVLYANRRVSEKRLFNAISVEMLRAKLKSEIIKDFKYYHCPTDRFFEKCVSAEKVYAELLKKYGKGKKIPYAKVAEEIWRAKRCEDVVVCPLMTSNMFESVLNINKVLKSRKIGEIKFITPGLVELV